MKLAKRVVSTNLMNERLVFSCSRSKPQTPKARRSKNKKGKRDEAVDPNYYHLDPMFNVLICLTEAANLWKQSWSRNLKNTTGTSQFTMCILGFHVQDVAHDKTNTKQINVVFRVNFHQINKNQRECSVMFLRSGTLKVLLGIDF